MKLSTTIRADAVDIERWERAANLSGLSYSEWTRRALNQIAGVTEATASVGVEFTEPSAEPPAKPKRQKISKLASSLPKTGFGWYAIAREQKRGRCTYLATAGTKCPQCKEVHPL